MKAISHLLGIAFLFPPTKQQLLSPLFSFAVLWGGANVLKYLFGGDFIAYNDKKQIITYEKYFHQTI